jgi:polysaccharide pyruvyl transferase WcaK-like protein
MRFPFGDFTRYPGNAQAIQDQLIGKFATFASLLARDFSLQLFGNDIKSDLAEIEELRALLLNRHRISIPAYVPPKALPELMASMSGMDFVITCRFHGVVFAHLLNKPVFAIAHHPKVTHHMEALGLSEYCVDMRSFDPTAAADRFRSLVDDAETVKRKMDDKLADYRRKLRSEFDELFPPASLRSSTWEREAIEEPERTTV